MKFPLWGTILTVICVAILCGLGTWQIKRLHWKTDLLAALDAEYAKDPMDTELTAAHLATVAPDQHIARGFIEGAFLNDKAVNVGPRTHDGKPGYHVITPFETLDHHIMLVNRGWIPLGRKDGDYAKPEQSMIITGTARRPQKPGPFVPDNNPAGGEWFSIAPAQIATAEGLDNVLPWVLYSDGRENGAAAYPIADAARWRPPNNHRNYAIFWFSMAGVMLVIYYLRFFYRRKPG